MAGLQRSNYSVTELKQRAANHGHCAIPLRGPASPQHGTVVTRSRPRRALGACFVLHGFAGCETVTWVSSMNMAGSCQG